MTSPSGRQVGSEDDPLPPVADDDFPEFAEPPRQKPSREDLDRQASEAAARSAPDSDAQSRVDDVLARLRRERAEDA